MNTNTNTNSAATSGGQEPTPLMVQVGFNPSLDRKQGAWACKAIKAIQADRVPALVKLLDDRKHPVFGKPFTIHSGGEGEPDNASLLEMALVARSYGCVEALSMRWHEDDRIDEVDAAAEPFMEAYERRPEIRNSPVFALSFAALARGMFKAQASNGDYGIASFAFEYPMASQAVARIHAEQSPVPGPGSKTRLKRAYWLRQADRCLADNNPGKLADCLAELDALPWILDSGTEFMELHLLLMSCVGMKRLACSSPIFEHVAGRRDLAQANGFMQHFLGQLAGNLPHASMGLSSGEEDQVAAGLASIVLSFNEASRERSVLLKILGSPHFQAEIGTSRAIAGKVVVRVHFEAEREALMASIPTPPANQVKRKSSSM